MVKMLHIIVNKQPLKKIMEHKKLKRIEDYDKNLPIVEVYTAVQSEGSRAGYPTVVIRTTGCTHRCYFGEGGWCDSWYTSIHPEKGQYNFNDIIKAYEDNPHIKEMMLTGGSPTMHGALVNELTHFANENDIFITIETEGSHFLPTDYPINLLSISPKFSNSVPVVGVETPQGGITDERMVKQHNKLRLIVTKDEALEILDEIAENVNTCCAITMEPDEVLVLIDKLKSYIE